jgi:hypothetical protein
MQKILPLAFSVSLFESWLVCFGAKAMSSFGSFVEHPNTTR